MAVKEDVVFCTYPHLKLMCKLHYFWFENRNWMYYNQITEHIAVNYVKVSNLHKKTHVQVEGEEKVMN